MRLPGIQLLTLTVCGLLLTVPARGAETNAASAGTTLPRHLSPVEFFRGLLGMSNAERERALAGRTPQDRAVILAKLREYEAMPRGIREARLCQTELHWELATLMQLAPSERSNRLNEVSVLYRPMVDNLLKQWDELPAQKQRALLAHEGFISTYLKVQESPAAARWDMIDRLPPGRRRQWAQDLERWRAMPEADRAELCAQFNRFFSLSLPEQKETVSPLSEAERKEMEQVLQQFDHLPPAQRTACINSFHKFASMTPEERNQFLKNASRWDAMTAHERQLWSELVRTLPPMPPMPPLPGLSTPPMPPDVSDRPPPLPPMPPNVTTPVIVARARNE